MLIVCDAKEETVTETDDRTESQQDRGNILDVTIGLGINSSHRHDRLVSPLEDEVRCSI